MYYIYYSEWLTNIHQKIIKISIKSTDRLPVTTGQSKPRSKNIILTKSCGLLEPFSVRRMPLLKIDWPLSNRCWATLSFNPFKPQCNIWCCRPCHFDHHTQKWVLSAALNVHLLPHHWKLLLYVSLSSYVVFIYSSPQRLLPGFPAAFWLPSAIIIQKITHPSSAMSAWEQEFTAWCLSIIYWLYHKCTFARINQTVTKP